MKLFLHVGAPSDEDLKRFGVDPEGNDEEAWGELRDKQKKWLDDNLGFLKFGESYSCTYGASHTILNTEAGVLEVVQQVLARDNPYALRCDEQDEVEMEKMRDY